MSDDIAERRRLQTAAEEAWHVHAFWLSRVWMTADATDHSPVDLVDHEDGLAVISISTVLPLWTYSTDRPVSFRPFFACSKTALTSAVPELRRISEVIRQRNGETQTWSRKAL